MKTARPDLNPCLGELLDLAVRAEPRIDRDALEAVLIDAINEGKEWRWALSQVSQMLCRGEEPRDIRNALRQTNRYPAYHADQQGGPQ